MQKIMFNDQYGLTKAVLEGKKTQTRRLALNVEDTQVFNLYPKDESIRKYVKDRYSRYSIGETLAVAQCLKDLGYDANDRSGGAIWGLDHTAAWNNKMFVSAKQCKHQIRITGIRLERLQDISDEDCLAEGIRRWKDEEEYRTSERVRNSVDEMNAAGYDAYAIPGHWGCFTSPKAAYAALIDKISGKGTWEKNPWVFVYDFELVNNKNVMERIIIIHKTAEEEPPKSGRFIVGRKENGENFTMPCRYSNCQEGWNVGQHYWSRADLAKLWPFWMEIPNFEDNH